MRKEGYLGNLTSLLLHMSTQNKNTMSTAEVQAWFKTNLGSFPESYVKEGYKLDDCQIDHILPRSIGGADHPFNYFILPKEVNQRWSGWWTKEKRAYMGKDNFEKFSHFILWTRREAERCGLQYKNFQLLGAV